MFKFFAFAAKLGLCIGLLLTALSLASDWQLIGPEGGNVRSLAYDPSDPNRILLGTSSGQLFISQDGGASWALFTHLGPGDDYVVDHVVFDPTSPATVYAAAWGLFNDNDGGVFRSDDGGRTWQELMGVHGKSIRALAMAPSDHNTLVIGALDGVFRSRDGGVTWQRISPENHLAIENHSSLKNFVSVAIDPQNPDVIYAGTRHLPWKTSDGGANWHNLKEGILDDSDVFSIIVDPKTPNRVYASACSGIYLSENGAELFHRVQGLPHSAIRTRVLRQDPQRPAIVYAGTTGGLWKTADNGAKWKLVSTPDVIVNDVLIDPRNPDRVMVATDLRGVLVSNDGFAHYTTSNRGFSHRVVGDVIADRRDPDRVYVGLVNDKEMGGLFASDDAGKSWRQSSRGLADRDILSLQQAENGALIAGTNHGIFSLATVGGWWVPAVMIEGAAPSEVTPEPVAPKAKSSKGSAASARKTAVSKPKAAFEAGIPLDNAPRVRSLCSGEKAWYAATNEGLFLSVDQGKQWYGQPVAGESNFRSVNCYDGGTVTLAAHTSAYISRDQGKTWSAVVLPKYVSGIYNLTVMPDASLWLGTSQGALHSTDGGQSWRYMVGVGLPKDDVLAVRYDAGGHRLLATALRAHGVFESKDDGQSWQSTPVAEVAIRSAMNYQGRILAASPYNGLLLQSGAAESAAKAGEHRSSVTQK